MKEATHVYIVVGINTEGKERVLPYTAAETAGIAVLRAERGHTASWSDLQKLGYRVTEAIIIWESNNETH